MNRLNLPWLMVCMFWFGAREGGLEDWSTVDDRVMGGVSLSRVVAADSCMRWEGMMSLESNGGFVSVRSPWERGQLRQAKKVTMRVRGSQGTFALRLATSGVYYEPIHQVGFDVDEVEWKTLTWSLEAFETTVMGRSTGSKFDAGDAGDVGRIGLMKNDGNPGPFWLEVDFIRFE